MEGGSDTSSSLILAIIQALILNPDVQEKAHREMASVVGEDSVVFEIGDQDMSDDEDDGKSPKRHTSQHHQGDRRHGDDVEREGLMNGDSGHKDRED